MQTLIRELNEELGAVVKEKDVVNLGAVTEDISHHTDLIYVFFWHDKEGTITGCYEGEAIYYDNINQALQHPKMMDGVRWLLNTCREKGFIK